MNCSETVNECVCVEVKSCLLSMFRSRNMIQATVLELWVFILRKENRKYILHCDRVTAMWGNSPST